MSPDSLSRLGREETAPLETDEITSQDKAVPRPEPLPADQASFLETDTSNVTLVTWKLAEDGDGMILRFGTGWQRRHGQRANSAAQRRVRVELHCHGAKGPRLAGVSSRIQFSHQKVPDRYRASERKSGNVNCPGRRGVQPGLEPQPKVNSPRCRVSWSGLLP